MFNLLLQILDEGRLTDSVGKTINFKNTIIVLTSNIGLQSFNQAQSIGFETHDRGQREALDQRYERLKEKVLGDVERTFRPEFINRLDKIVVFRPLDQVSVERIVDLKIEELQQRLSEQRIRIQLTAKARTKIAELGFSPEYGARAVSRMIQEHVENPLAGMLLNGQVKSGQTVKIGLQRDKITVEKAVRKR